MIRTIIISYTEMGEQLNTKLVCHLSEAGHVALSCRYGAEFDSTAEMLSKEWQRTSAFIFVGAMGIAVRHIAPLLTDKLHDPAVLVVDEQGQFVIPVLSGHIGGGVELAYDAARMLGAQAVVTTATDVEKRFAVDIFAKKNHLLIPNSTVIREISSAILRGSEIEVRTRVPIEGDIPAGLQFGDDREAVQAGLPLDDDGGAIGLCQTDGKEDVCFGWTGGPVYRLSLRPYIVGIGCKKGKSGEELFGFFQQVCRQCAIEESRIAAIASIDVKKEETGIWEFSRRLGVPYEVFSAAELDQIAESVNASAFVRQTVGVDNVCERSALCLARRFSQTAAYELVVEKQAQDGMTIAIAKFHPAVYRW